jgi:hypothetical protein
MPAINSAEKAAAPRQETEQEGERGQSPRQRGLRLLGYVAVLGWQVPWYPFYVAQGTVENRGPSKVTIFFGLPRMFFLNFYISNALGEMKMRLQSITTIVNVLVVVTIATQWFCAAASFQASSSFHHISSILNQNLQYDRPYAKVIVLSNSLNRNNDRSEDADDSSPSMTSFERLRPETSFGSETVPEGQRPINEYLEMMRAPLFGWATTGNVGLLIRIGILYTIFFALVCYPISGATFTQDGYMLQKLAASNVGACFVIFLLLVRLYTGWGYIGQRLSSKVIEYEETGWYDGDWEEKTETEFKRDRMLFQSEVQPIVNRLRNFTISSCGLLLASIVSFNVALANKPLFDQYDPAVLERLAYDDKLAGKAAANTGGKPAYCDSRYYRAVANGGQGCD